MEYIVNKNKGGKNMKKWETPKIAELNISSTEWVGTTWGNGHGNGNGNGHGNGNNHKPGNPWPGCGDPSQVDSNIE